MSSEPRITHTKRNTYTLHHCADPSYPQTTIIPRGVNDYDIQYAHGKPLSDFNIDDCPDSVFNYDCHYYKSLMSMKQMYESRIAEASHKLDAHNEALMHEYVNNHIDEHYNKATKRVSKSIDKLSHMSAEDLVRDMSSDTSLANARDIAHLKADIAADLDDQRYALSSVEDEVTEDLENQWYAMYQTTKESKHIDETIHAKWVSALAENEREVRNWKQTALDAAIEYERVQISEFNAIPRNGADFKKQLQKMTAKLLSDSTADVKSSAFDIVCSKLPKGATDKYGDQLNTMIMLHKRNRCYVIIDEFMNRFKAKLNTALSHLCIDNFVEATDWYDVKKYLFPLIESTTNAMSRIIFTEVSDRLSLIQKYTDTISNLQQMSRLATDIVNGISSVLNDVHIDPNIIDDDPTFAKLVDGVDTLNTGFSDKTKKTTHRKPARSIKGNDDY